MNWELLVSQYLAQYPDTHFRVREILEDLVRGGRKVLSRAIDLEIAEASKPESTWFLLYLTAHALQDHTLTDAEVSDLRTLRRVFRIHEGDLRKHHPETVTSLLCRQAELIFEDQAISREEAIYKAPLQEAFGLGYDEFMGILEPELNRLVRDLYEALDSNGLADWLGADWRRASDRLAALSLVRYVEGLAKGRSSRAGYIYLLVNSSMPGIVKIGHTGQPPRRRAEELASATGVPTPFTLVFDLLSLMHPPLRHMCTGY